MSDASSSDLSPEARGPRPEASYRELVLGCGSRREKIVAPPGHTEWSDVTRLDANPDHAPDVVWDLERKPWPFDDDAFDEVHAYELLEHLGQQGDAESFFADFSEIWRVLKPGGVLCATVPAWDSVWAWGDPGHRRVISEGSLAFLSQAIYEQNVGATPMSDYRYLYQADFQVCLCERRNETLCFVLRAVKPARTTTNLEPRISNLEQTR